MAFALIVCMMLGSVVEVAVELLFVLAALLKKSHCGSTAACTAVPDYLIWPRKNASRSVRRSIPAHVMPCQAMPCYDASICTGEQRTLGPLPLDRAKKKKISRLLRTKTHYCGVLAEQSEQG